MSADLKFSVIIPTYNRAFILQEALRALLEQSLPEADYEVIVVNDGSTDNTREVVSRLLPGKGNIIYLEQRNAGPAAARNYGLRQAKGEYIFFTGDDIIASRDLLKQHLEAHWEFPGDAVLGYTVWDEREQPTKFMEFLERWNHQFNYSGLVDGRAYDWRFFYTSNISLSRKRLAGELFDEKLRYPAWEDLELGFRLHQNGIKVVFNKKALAFHCHRVGEEEFFRKNWQEGVSRVYCYRKFPETKNIAFEYVKVKIILALLKGRRIYEKLLGLFGLQELIWEMKVCYYTNLGLRDGLEQRTDLSK